MPPVLAKRVVKSPAGHELRSCAETRVVKPLIITLIEQMKNRVLIQFEIATGDFSAQALAHRCDLFENAPDVFARALGIVNLLAPDRFAFDELFSKGFPFETGVF